MKNNDYELAKTLGILSDSEAQSLQQYVDSAGSTEVSDDVRAAAEILAQIGLAAPVPSVRSDLKQRLKRRLEEQKRSDEIQVWRKWGASEGEADGPTIIPATEDFQATGVDGVSVRKLHVDPVSAQATMLVRMEPGSAYPAHRHAADEICYVLEGELAVGEQRMAAGDFQHVSRGQVHQVQSTTAGCLLLITSSLNDEILPG